MTHASVSANPQPIRCDERLSVWRLAWPMFIEQTLRFAVGTADTIMLSRVSDDAAAAVGIASNIVAVGMVLFSFVSIGSSVVLTHHLGAADGQGGAGVARAAIAANTLLGLLVSGAVVLFAGPLLRLIQVPAPLFSHAHPYLSWMGGTLFLEAQNIALASVLRAHGQTRPVMVVMATKNVLGVVGNAALLFGAFGLPRLGAQGVAISGIFARFICLCVLHRLVRRRTQVHLRCSDYTTASLAAIQRVLRIGMPAAGESLNYWIAWTVVMGFASHAGPAQVAALVYARQFTLFVLLFETAVGFATEVLVGHRVGAGAVDAAYRLALSSLRSGLAITFLAGGLAAISAPHLYPLLTPNAAVAAAAATLQALALPLELGRICNTVLINSLRAAGDTRFALLLGCVSTWALWVPLAWTLAVHFNWGVAGIYAAMICDEWLRGAVHIARWTGRRWDKYAARSRLQVGT